MEHSPASRVSHGASLPSLFHTGHKRRLGLVGSHLAVRSAPPPPIIKGLSSCPTYRYFLVSRTRWSLGVYTTHPQNECPELRQPDFKIEDAALIL